jgi:hypothetical protein
MAVVALDLRACRQHQLHATHAVLVSIEANCGSLPSGCGRCDGCALAAAHVAAGAGTILSTFVAEKTTIQLSAVSGTSARVRRGGPTLLSTARCSTHAA